MTLILLIFIEIHVKYQIDRKKMILSSHCTCQTWLAEQKLFPNSNFIQTSFKKLTVTINGKKKQNSLLCQNLEALWSLWRMAKFYKSLKLGIVLFFMLLVDRFSSFIWTDSFITLAAINTLFWSQEMSLKVIITCMCLENSGIAVRSVTDGDWPTLICIIWSTMTTRNLLPQFTG